MTSSKLEVRLQPGARICAVARFEDGILYAKVTARPQKGEANRALLELLSAELEVPVSRLGISHGHTSRKKLVLIERLTREEVEKRLSRFAVETKPEADGACAQEGQV
ncbi:MAG: DUF167 domain-containing protein [Dehalococcoidia bacterium]|nr:DUF167 domain-containing protein [Dehalococcoidia bacterium]